MRKIKLLINGEMKIFTIPFVNAMVWRKFIEFKSTMNLTNLMPEQVDDLAELVVYAFGNQFTLEQLYEGVPHDKIMTLVDELFMPSDSTDEDDFEGNGKK